MAKIQTSVTGSNRSAALSIAVRRFGLQPGAGSGFTLLELVVAIAIAAIVLGVSAPAMQRLYTSSQYHGAVNKVVTILTSARYAAIRKGGEQDVLINPETREIRLGDKVEALPEAVKLEVLGSKELNRDGAAVIRFFADGGSSGGLVNLAHESGMTVQVQVDWLLGRVSLCKTDCDEL